MSEDQTTVIVVVLFVFCCCLGGGSSHGHKQLDFKVIMIYRASGSGPVSKLQTVPLNTTYAKMIKQFNILNCSCVADCLSPFFPLFWGGGGGGGYGGGGG